MDHVQRRPRHRVLAVALATVLVPLLAGSASGGTSKPTVTLAPTVTGANVSVQIDVNRGTKQVASCTYVLDSDAPASCGTKAAIGAKATRYTFQLASQAVGGHSIVVTVRLTDGGSGSRSASFTIAAPPAHVFARAFRDDGNHVYDPGTDALFSELVDSNGSQSLDKDDTVIVHALPTDFVGGTTGVGVSTHLVTGVLSNGSAEVEVFTTTGQFAWRSAVDFEAYAEGGDDGSTVLFDFVSGDIELSLTDSIEVASSPSQPLSTVFHATKPREADDTWLDVAITPPG